MHVAKYAYSTLKLKYTLLFYMQSTNFKLAIKKCKRSVKTAQPHPLQKMAGLVEYTYNAMKV